MAGAGGTGEGGMQRRVGGGGEWATGSQALDTQLEGALGMLRAQASCPRDSRGTLPLHYLPLPLELCWLLGKWSVF